MDDLLLLLPAPGGLLGQEPEAQVLPHHPLHQVRPDQHGLQHLHRRLLRDAARGHHLDAADEAEDPDLPDHRPEPGVLVRRCRPCA